MLFFSFVKYEEWWAPTSPTGPPSGDFECEDGGSSPPRPPQALLAALGGAGRCRECASLSSVSRSYNPLLSSLQNQSLSSHLSHHAAGVPTEEDPDKKAAASEPSMGSPSCEPQRPLAPQTFLHFRHCTSRDAQLNGPCHPLVSIPGVAVPMQGLTEKIASGGASSGSRGSRVQRGIPRSSRAFAQKRRGKNRVDRSAGGQVIARVPSSLSPRSLSRRGRRSSPCSGSLASRGVFFVRFDGEAVILHVVGAIQVAVGSHGRQDGPSL